MHLRTKIFFLIATVVLAAPGPEAHTAAQNAAYRIRAVAGLHGTITPRGWVTVHNGESQTFAIVPDTGYRIADVTVDRVSRGPVASYTFSTVQAHHRIVAAFKKQEPEGQSDFHSALPSGGRVYSLAPEGAGGDKNGRTIEEGDIVKVYENTLFVLNQYRGLQLIDITDSSNPSLLATVPLYGYPVELYVRDGNAYVVVSNYFNCWYSSLKAETESFQGSQIAIVDVRNKKSPQISGGIDIKGFITDTRLVGSILYAVSNQYSYYYYNAPSSENLTTISAVSIADPSQIAIVNEMSFPMPASSYENNVHVTPDRIFLAQYGWGHTDKAGNWVETDATDITCIDISDETGLIRKGKTVSVPGVVLNRWQMDFYNGYFRVITPEKYWGNGFPSLYIYTVESPDTIEPVSSLTLKIDRPESLMSVRFAGDAAYAVTYERKDPLFSIDLKDPAQPRQLAALSMSGWIDYIEPKTDNLVTLGHDDADGNPSLAVSLFDVTGIDNPLLVNRVHFGEGYGWVPADINDMHKAFKVLDDLHLILVPFSSWSAHDNAEISGVQLIDYFFDAERKGLTKRGLIEHSGWVERAIPYDSATVLTVSNEAFQTVDISNRDNPQIKKVLELARNSVAIQELASDTGLELSTGTRWYSYDQAKSKLSVVPLSDPNTPSPFDTIEISGYFEKLYSMKGCSLLTGFRYDEKQGNIITVESISYDGADFNMLGSLEITGLNDNYWIYAGRPFSYYPYGQSSRAVKVSATALVFTGSEYYYTWPETNAYSMVMKAVDVSDPKVLRVVSTVTADLQGGFPTFTWWDGSTAYVSYAVPFNGEPGVAYYKYYYKTVDFSDIQNPQVSEGINVPGNVVGISLNRQYIYTIDYQYASPPDTYACEVYINTLEPIEGKAYLRDREKIVPATADSHESWYPGTVVVYSEKAYFVVNHSTCSEDYSTCQYDAKLWTADLADPQDITFPSSQTLHVQSADIIDVQQNKLFLSTYAGAGGIIIYSLENPLTPSFKAFYRTDYYPGEIVVIKDKAYLPSGMYGVKVIPLN
ncbi:MAG: beta-propeller domain-containing protein [Proteobacteria bacterium]|nr:beta-propeller domain-containing protein [Pseudomonadota bacterium]